MEGKVTEYVVAVDDVRFRDETAHALQASLGSEYEVQTWEQLRPGLRDMRLVQRAVLGVLSFIFLIIALFGVANTLLMSVLERTREIGTLLAVGMTRAKVASLFMLEALLQAVVGASLGVVTALVVISLARTAGGFSISMGGGAFFKVMPTLLPAVPVIVVVAACVGSVLAALSPAMRAARMRPVEALSSS
jgi:putative ABC transport system permease protein